MSLHEFKNWSDDLKAQDEAHPVLFIGHGSPMNGIEDNEFSRTWTKFGYEIPKLKAVLVIKIWVGLNLKITIIYLKKQSLQLKLKRLLNFFCLCKWMVRIVQQKKDFRIFQPMNRIIY